MTKKPEWLRIRHRTSPHLEAVETLLEAQNLNTVCREANCPNYLECFSKKTATFMILGTNCTRNCSFCNVRFDTPMPIDIDEPVRIAEAVKTLGLQYVVITSVTRDDLLDGGAGQFAQVIYTLRQIAPDTAVEVLIPDFCGDMSALQGVVDAKPAVLGHNMETVASKYPLVRSGAVYTRSLDVIARVAREPHIHAKSGIMLGLGETEEEVLILLDDLRSAGCEFLTIGQYLAPTKSHYPVQAYIRPERFEFYKEKAYEKGFSFVASAPFVRSSYQASAALGL